MITFKQDPQNKKVFLQIERAADDILSAVERTYWEAGKILEKYLQKGLKRGTRTGAEFLYKGRKLKASNPGEFPQRRTGELKESVGFTVFSHQQMVFGITNPGKTGKDTNYANYLEDGTSKMLPRNLVGYTVNKNNEIIKNLLQKRIDAAIKEK